MGRMRRLALVVLAATAAAVGGVAAGQPAGAAGASSIFLNPLNPTTSPGPIQHVIVIVQSGHSFDNYFGTRPGVDGIPTSACVPIVAGSKVCVKPTHLNPDEARAGLSDTLGVTQKSIDNGKMDGFVGAQANTAIGTVSMGYLDGTDLPYYWNLASRFTLFDHFYASSQAGSLPNRLIAISGQADGIDSNAPPTGGITNVPTIFDQLDQKDISWKYYVQDYHGTASPSAGEVARTPLLAMPSVTGSPAQAARIVDSSRIFDDLAAGKLPSVSYVTGSTDSELSPQSPAGGEEFVRSIINAVMQSSSWDHTAILLTYDDSGGWYDHSPPPVVGGTRLGLRVPTLLISPYARAGYVDSNQLDTASIPAYIEHVFQLQQLSASEATAGSIVTALNVDQTPIAPVIGPENGSAPAIVRPSVGIVYVLYLAALLGACFLVALAFARQRRSYVVNRSGLLAARWNGKRRLADEVETDPAPSAAGPKKGAVPDEASAEQDEESAAPNEESAEPNEESAAPKEESAAPEKESPAPDPLDTTEPASVPAPGADGELAQEQSPALVTSEKDGGTDGEEQSGPPDAPSTPASSDQSPSRPTTRRFSRRRAPTPTATDLLS
jgi:phospholipase C